MKDALQLFLHLHEVEEAQPGFGTKGDQDVDVALRREVLRRTEPNSASSSTCHLRQKAWTASSGNGSRACEGACKVMERNLASYPEGVKELDA